MRLRLVRLDQMLSHLGYCSRSEAREWVRAGRIRVAGSPAKRPDEKVSPGDVRIDGAPPDHPDGILLAMNKPLGRVCSHDVAEGASVYDLLPPRWRQRNPGVTSVGRLDKETTGLLLLTDQSALVHRLTSPKNKVLKTYRAVVDHDLDEELIARFARGDLTLDGEAEPCAPARLVLRDSRTAELELGEGRYHQVRRMFAACGWSVTTLQRIRFGDLELGDVPVGQWRELPLNHFST